VRWLAEKVIPLAWRAILKLLVVVNNHNSLGIVDFCINLKKHDESISVAVACTADIEAAHNAAFEKNEIKRLVVQPGRRKAEDKKRISEAKVDNAESESKHRGKTKGDSWATVIIRWLIGLASSSSLYCVLREQFIVNRLRRCKKTALKFIEDTKPDIVISISDRSHDYVEASILWAAKHYGTPIVIPYVAQYDMDAAVVYRSGPAGKPNPELRPLWPFSIYKLISYFRLKHQLYRGIFFQSPYVLNASRRSGTLSAYPWWIGNGNSDIVCVDSEHTAAKYVRHGVKRGKIVVIGHVSYDRVFSSYADRRAIRAKLISKYSLRNDRVLLVLSVPQYAEQGYMTWERHWHEIHSIIGEVSSSNANLLLSIHPRSDTKKYELLAEKYGCSILEEPLSDVIGAGGLFLASNSSTFTWAALCGISSIALMSPVPFLYAHLESVHPAESEAGLAKKIDDLLKSAPGSFERDWELLSRREVFDGRFNERFLQLLRNACERRQKASKGVAMCTDSRPEIGLDASSRS
jgi:hypothetical protein